jgi:hypothetical protein
MPTDRERRLQEEYDRSHDHLRRYHEKNPGALAHPEVQAMAHHLCTAEQLKDLEAAGLIDRDAFRRAGREPTAQEIQDHHLLVRSHGGYGVRGADELIEHVHRRLVPPRNKDGQFTKR